MLNVKHLRTKTANAHSFDSCLPKAYNNIIVRFDLARSMVLSDRRILSKTVEISLMHVCLTEKATVIKHMESSVNQLMIMPTHKEVCARICCQLQIIARKLKWFRRTIIKKLQQTNITVFLQILYHAQNRDQERC